MRMLLEQLGGRLVRSRANDRVTAQLIGDVFNALASHPFRLAERSAHTDNRGLMLIDPHLPPGEFLSCIFARRSSSGSAFQAAMRGLVLLPRKTARYVSFVLMVISFLCALRVEAELDIAAQVIGRCRRRPCQRTIVRPHDTMDLRTDGHQR